MLLRGLSEHSVYRLSLSSETQELDEEASAALLATL